MQRQLGTLGLALSLSLMSVISTAIAQSQNCNDNIIETAPAARFTVNLDGNGNPDGTVTDKQTGLMWARCPQGLSGGDCMSGTSEEFNWPEALNLNIASSDTIPGRDDWRLPNLKELSSLLESKCLGPATNLAVFPNPHDLGFWSSSPSISDEREAFAFDYINGLIFSFSRNRVLGARLVRGPLAQ